MQLYHINEYKCENVLIKCEQLQLWFMICSCQMVTKILVVIGLLIVSEQEKKIVKLQQYESH